jgi:hypothetical protein
MGIDIRVPIGLMFIVFGVLLASFGLLSNHAIYQCSLGINVNLVWGSVLLACGLACLMLRWYGQRR